MVRARIAPRWHAAPAALAGGPDPVGEHYMQPTVLLEAPEETFGPTPTIAKVPYMDEAVRRANASSYGLGAAVFTRRPRHPAGPPDPHWTGRGELGRARRHAVAT